MEIAGLVRKSAHPKRGHVQHVFGEARAIRHAAGKFTRAFQHDDLQRRPGLAQQLNRDERSTYTAANDGDAKRMSFWVHGLRECFSTGHSSAGWVAMVVERETRAALSLPDAEDNPALRHVGERSAEQPAIVWKRNGTEPPAVR